MSITSQDQPDCETYVGILHYEKTGTSEGLWDCLGRRISRMEMADAFNCSNLWTTLLQPATTLGSQSASRKHR